MGLTREEKAVREAEKRAERERKAFEESPPGQARTAFGRGDGYFEIEMDLRDTGSLNSHGLTRLDGHRQDKTGRTDALSLVEAEGWSLIQASHMFVQTGEDSRDKILRSGQRTAVKGKIVGIYLFRRREDARPPGLDR